jgi:tetratricopeptide (TPR) repeat protein
MKVPFHLRRRASAEPAVALLLLGHDSEELLRLCARLGHDPVPAVFAVADGFLLKLTRPVETALAGCVRLRGLSPDLLLPVDADLVPGLLPDEAEALVRRRGLVFLPSGRALEFDPAHPLPLAALLAASVRREPWQSLPHPSPLADRITEVVVETPPGAADAVLEAGGEGVGTEAPRPSDASLPAKALGKAALGMGKGLGWLGHKLGLGALGRAGAALAGAALALAPRLSESLMGKHEASLRELLRDFEEGNLERALRRAVPLGGDTARGSGLHPDAHLPAHEASYSLWDILRGYGGRGGGFWYSSAETYWELEKQYRKAAEQAVRKGDHRRAAFIYGKLLGDYRMAAAVLAQGGLHRDAALIYLHKLSNHLAAAREYEAAGDVDRALRLYRQHGEHALAGDLLRRVGEDELAVAEYQLAAAQLARADAGQYQAGELLATRAGRFDLALPYFAEGWKRRPYGSAIPCAIRLAQIYTMQEEFERLLALVGEAEVHLAPPGNDAPAGEFFNEVARLAVQLKPGRLPDELSDRALLALASKLRQRVEGGTATGAVGVLLGPSTVWAPAQVSDAEFAVKQASARRSELKVGPGRQARTQIRARVPVVTAVGWAPESEAIVLGFQSGEVVLFRPLAGEVVPISREDHAVVGIAVSPNADKLVVLSDGDGPVGYLTGYTQTSGYGMTTQHTIRPAVDPWVGPLLVGTDNSLVFLWDGQEFSLLRMPALLREVPWTSFNRPPDPTAALPLHASPDRAAVGAWLDLFLFSDTYVNYYPDLALLGPAFCFTKALGWRPSVPPGSTLQRPPLAWLPAGRDALEVAAIGAHGMLCWAHIRFPEGKLSDDMRRATMTMAQPCLAATLIRPGLVATVTGRAVYWFRVVGQGFAQAAAVPESFPNAEACFPHHRGNELMIVCADGTIARLAMPQA